MDNKQSTQNAIEVLKNTFGFSNYRYGQREIIENI